jgi:uncharacterized protein
MQLTLDSGALHYIRAWEPGRVRIVDRWVSGNVIIGAEHIIEGWTTVPPSALTLADLDPALALEPAIVIVGTGTSQALPDVEIMAELAARGIGVEFMSTPAACRTFNVLLQERRRVVAALFNG